ncbi:MAG: PH domain-containing protein [Blastocatellia bacterium]
MYCHSCGRDLAPNSLFCNACGAATGTARGTLGVAAASIQGGGTFPAGQQDSQVLFSVRPAFYEAGFAYAVAALLCLLAAGVAGWFGWRWQYVAGAAVIFLAPAMYRHIQRNRIVYTLTRGRMTIDAGVFSRTTMNIPVRNVQNVTTSATLGQRLMGIGDVIIDSASDAGKIVMQNIRNPGQYADQILAQLQRRF